MFYVKVFAIIGGFLINLRTVDRHEYFSKKKKKKKNIIS